MKLENFILKSQTVAEKTAKKFRGPLFSAAPCRSNMSLSEQSLAPRQIVKNLLMLQKPTSTQQ